MMKVIPAIDLIGQQVVRLTQGDFEQKTSYRLDPVELAQEFERAGFSRLHVVDLEGAKAGETRHLEVLSAICHSTGLQVDFGGGVRTADQVRKILDAGAVMISLGSITVKEPVVVKEWIRIFGSDKFFLGADVKGKQIAINAWQSQSDLNVTDFIANWMEQGIHHFFSTDVERDGRMEGPAIELYRLLISQFQDIQLTASGGVSCLADLEELEACGVAGAIVGKAIYEGKIGLDELAKWK